VSFTIWDDKPALMACGQKHSRRKAHSRGLFRFRVHAGQRIPDIEGVPKPPFWGLAPVATEPDMTGKRVAERGWRVVEADG
jgi:hypothetical protein